MRAIDRAQPFALSDCVRVALAADDVGDNLGADAIDRPLVEARRVECEPKQAERGVLLFGKHAH
ncbi:hypothetical protein, partial [Mesorhizobium sp. M5C.F.Ca.IN.020.32.2.1]|uniref:hypothetical protein n=1 Tax=Mesorhizobium sp. M5C.F.Ca.IN.020.32.2.1 TaxID=2496771 RepID=UPI0032AF6355